MFYKGIFIFLGSYCVNVIKMLKINLYVFFLFFFIVLCGMRIFKLIFMCYIVSMCVIKCYGLIWDIFVFYVNRGVVIVSCIIMSYMRN